MSMEDARFAFDAEEYVAAYGISGAIQAAMVETSWALYKAVAAETGCEPVDEDEFFSYYNDGEAGGMLRHEVEVDFENLGIVWPEG